MTELTEDEIIKQLGTVFKNHRLLSGLSQGKLYEDKKICVGIVSDFENAKHSISLRSFIRLWKALDIPISEITKAMTQKIPELELDIRPVKCCANCANSSKEWAKGNLLICNVISKSTSPDLCCRKYKGELNG